MNCVSVHNRTYNVPNIDTNNKQNFVVLKDIMLSYHYFEFLDNFDNIYNNFDDYHKRACYWICTICDEYDKIKSKNKSLNLTKIIQRITDQANKKYRFNNKVFHLNYIGFILYWKYYKVDRNNCNTISKFNDILTDLCLPSNLTTGFPRLLKDFDNSFADVMKEVIEANKIYYQRKNELELVELDKKFHVEFKQRFDKYKSYLTTLRTVCGDIDWDIYTKIFIDYYEKCDVAIANHIISDLIKTEYGKLSKKYSLVNVDYKTNEITKMVFEDFSYYVEIGLKTYNDPKGVCDNVIKSYNKLCLMMYSYPKYKFVSNDHRDLINSLIQ